MVKYRAMENYTDSTLANKLSKAGLSQKEAVIYAFLLEREGAFPSVIAKETGLNRTTVYKILATLSVKGLVTEFEKRKKFFYQAENPHRLEKYADMQISLAKNAKENLGRIMPVLDGLHRSSPDKPVVRFFEGKEGVLAIYNEHVLNRKPYEMLAFSNTVGLLPLLSQEFKENYQEQKAKIGIATRAILPYTPENAIALEAFYKTLPKRLSPQIKYLSSEKFPFKGDLTLFGEKSISIINFNEPHFAGTIIEDQTIYNMIKLFFELTWDNLPEYEKSR